MASEIGPRPRTGILAIAPYVGGEGTDTGHALASNENPLGPGAAARAAFAEAGRRLHIYPDGGAIALRAAIAEVHGLDADRIVCGNGSDELLAMLCGAYAGPGDEVVHTQHGFLMYGIAARVAGARVVAVPETELKADVGAILDRVTDATRVVFLANPNNPTGSWIDRFETSRLARGLPSHVLLVLDAAYAEYMNDSDYEPGAALVETFPNVVMTRTFSKMHGLAALRMGWAYCPARVARVLDRVRGPFNANAAAQAAAAAAVRDAAHVERSADLNRRNRERLADGLRRIGVDVPQSAANFILARFRGSETARDADLALRSAGIVVRRMDGYGLPECLRISVGLERAVSDTLAALEARFGRDLNFE